METENKIKKILEKIKPMLQGDGGNIEFVKYEDNNVYVNISGVCMHCHMLDYTLEGIEATIKDEIPEVKQVLLANEENI